MSLIKCKECQREISSKANNCPHCGYTYKDGNAYFKISFLFLGAIVLIIITINLFTVLRN